MCGTESSGVQSFAAKENEQTLHADDQAGDQEEHQVVGDAFQDIETVVNASTVELIEYLHPHKDIEDERISVLK